MAGASGDLFFSELTLARSVPWSVLLAAGNLLESCIAAFALSWLANGRFRFGSLYLLAPIWSTVRWSMLLGGLISLSSPMLALSIARGISGPIGALEAEAAALMGGISVGSNLPETEALRRVVPECGGRQAFRRREACAEM